MIDENDPVYRAAFAPYQALIDANAETMEQINQKGEETAAALQAEQQDQWKALAEQMQQKAAAKADAAKSDEATDNPDGDNPDNPWAHPRRAESDFGPRVGYLDEDGPPPLTNDTPVAPDPVRASPPAPKAASSPGRHARHDDFDDDEFGGGGWLRG